MRVTAGGDLELRVFYNLSSFPAPTTANTLKFFLRNVNTGAVIVNNATIALTVGTNIQDDANYGAGANGHYIITVPGAGATLNNAAGQTYYSEISLTLGDATGTTKTFSGTFTQGIL